MKNPLKKLKAPKKKSKTDLSDVLFYVPLLISFVFAYFVYSKSNQLIISALIPISVFSISLLFKKEKREEAKGLKDVLLFYSRFLYFSSLEEDYHLGFTSAIDSLPICELKDKLTDYQENESNELPLTVTKKQSEFALISFISVLLHSDEEYSSSAINELERKISLFEKDCHHKEETPLTYVSSFLIIVLFIFVFFFSIISYE